MSRLPELLGLKHSCAFDVFVSLLQLDSALCREMSVSDTVASDLTWTDNSTFNLSEGHTPETENSEGALVYRRVASGGWLCVHVRTRASSA